MPLESRMPPRRRSPMPPTELVRRMPLSRRIGDRAACRAVRQVVAEVITLLGERLMERRDRRRLACHVRQIAMYVCHVTLRMPQQEIGIAFGRDRTTVGHACHVVEDRRDDPLFDDFVSAIERIVVAVFTGAEVSAHE